MTRKPDGQKSAADQTDRRSLEAHREGRGVAGTGIVLKHAADRKPGASPVIVLRDIAYDDLCEIGSRYLAYKWIAPSVRATAAPRPQPDCTGRSCAGRPCANPCVCDPATLRCIKISL